MLFLEEAEQLVPKRLLCIEKQSKNVANEIFLFIYSSTIDTTVNQTIRLSIINWHMKFTITPTCQRSDGLLSPYKGPLDFQPRSIRNARVLERHSVDEGPSKIRWLGCRWHAHKIELGNLFHDPETHSRKIFQFLDTVWRSMCRQTVDSRPNTPVGPRTALSRRSYSDALPVSTF